MMEKVKTFFHVFTNSLFPQAHYYRKVLKTRFSFSLKYFVLLVFCVNLIFVLFSYSRINQNEIAFVKNTFPAALGTFPKGLKITIKNGVLTSNTNHPYFLWLPPDSKKVLLLVMDETATPEKISEYDSYILLTSQQIVLNEKKFNQKTQGPDETTFQTIPYQKINLTIDKETANGIGSIFLRLFPWLVTFSIVGAVIFAPLFVATSYAMGLFFVSLTAFLLFKLFYKKHTFKKTYQLSMHAVTLPFIIEYANRYFMPHAMQSMRLIFFTMTLLFILSSLYTAYLEKK